MASKTTTPKPPTLAAQVSRAVVWNTLFVPLRLVADVIATLLKLTVLVPASYGFLSIFSSANNGLGTAIDLGTGRALPKYIPETLRSGGPQLMRRLLYTVFAAQLAVLALVALGLALFHNAYVTRLNQQIANTSFDTGSAIAAAARGELVNYVNQHIWFLIGLALVLQAISIFYDVLMSYLSAFFKQRAWNSVDITAQLLPKILTIAAVLLLPAGMQLTGLLVAMVLAPAIATAVLIWNVVRHQREIDTLAAPIAVAANHPLLPPGFVRYCGVSLLMNGSDFVASANFAILFARNLVDAAVLFAGVSIVRMVLTYLYTPMVGVQVPLFTRIRAGEGGTLNGAYQSLIRLQSLLLIPGGVGLMLLAEPVFATLLPKYTAAAPLVWVLVPCLFLESLLTTAHNALIVHEHLGSIVIARLLALIAAPLALLLAPPLGIIGVTVAFGVARVAAGLWVTLRGAQVLGLRWPWVFTLRVLAASAAMAAIVLLLKPFLPQLPADATTFVRLLALPALAGVAALGGAAMLLALRLLGGLDRTDREQLRKLKLPFKQWVARML